MSARIYHLPVNSSAPFLSVAELRDIAGPPLGRRAVIRPPEPTISGIASIGAAAERAIAAAPRSSARKQRSPPTPSTGLAT